MTGTLKAELVVAEDQVRQDAANWDAQTRIGFVRKVLLERLISALLSVQLMITAVIAFPIQLVATPDWIQQNWYLYRLAMFGSLAAVLGVSCIAPEVARTFPMNYVFLLFVTVCESIMVGFIAGEYTTQSVVFAAGLTGTVFLGLTAYAFTTENDFTVFGVAGFGGYLLAALLTLIGLTLLSFILLVPQVAIAGISAIIFSFYIIHDTQLMIGGKHAWMTMSLMPWKSTLISSTFSLISTLISSTFSYIVNLY